MKCYKYLRKLIFLYFLTFFFILNLSPVFAQDNSHSDTPLYIATQNIISKDKINQGKTRSIPLTIKTYIDSTAKLTCEQLSDSSFESHKSDFNPGFYDGLLWVDVTFPDTTDLYGKEYMLSLGYEPIQLAEVYIEKNGQWYFYGRTGRGLLRSQMTEINWRSCVPINMEDFDDSSSEEKEHHLRIKIQSFFGAPLHLRISSRTLFNYNTLKLTAASYCYFIFFLLITLFFISYGTFLHRDTAYLFAANILSIILVELELKGIGPVFLWNAFVPLKYNERSLYILCSISFLTVIILQMMQQSRSQIKQISILTPIAIFIVSFIILTSVTVSSTVVVHLFFVCSLIILCGIFATVLLFNIKRAPRDEKAVLYHWLPAIVVLGIRLLFSLLRTISPNRLFTIFDYDYYVFYDVIALFLIAPLFCALIKSFDAEYKSARAGLKEYKDKKKLNDDDKALFTAVSQKILDINNVSMNITNMSEFSKKASSKDSIFTLLSDNIFKTNQLLEINQILLNEQLPSPKPVLLKSFFAHSIDHLESFSKQRDISVSFTNAIESDFVTYINPDILEIFVFELFETTLSCTPRNTRMSVGVKYENGKLLIDISNKMTSSELKTASVSFIQHNEENSEYEYGMDITGFAIARRIAKFYDGDFTIKAITGGSKISTSLKIDHYSASEQSETLLVDQPLLPVEFENITDQEKNPVLAINGKLPVILIVDDNPANINLLHHTLQPYMDIIEASSGTEAWNILHSPLDRIPSVILCSYNIPLLSGSELMRKCGEESSLQHICFVFMLSIAQVSLEKELLKKGASACITKPFNIEHLFNIIFSILMNIKRIQRNVLNDISKAVSASELTEDDMKTEKKALPVDIPSQGLVALSASQTNLFSDSSLSPRERQIAILISSGKTDKEIAEELNISPGTVATHNKKLFKKLGVHSRVELINKVR